MNDKTKCWDVYFEGVKVGEIYSVSRGKAYINCIFSFCDAYGKEYKNEGFKKIRLKRNKRLDKFSFMYKGNLLLLEDLKEERKGEKDDYYCGL